MAITQEKHPATAQNILGWREKIHIKGEMGGGFVIRSHNPERKDAVLIPSVEQLSVCRRTIQAEAARMVILSNGHIYQKTLGYYIRHVPSLFQNTEEQLELWENSQNVKQSKRKGSD